VKNGYWLNWIRNPNVNEDNYWDFKMTTDDENHDHYLDVKNQRYLGVYGRSHYFHGERHVFYD
jgi:hypothetical protein